MDLMMDLMLDGRSLKVIALFLWLAGGGMTE